MAEIVVKLVNGELAGRTAQTIAKEVNAAALALKKAEVGTQAWVDANAKLEGAKKLQTDYKKQIEATTKASSALKESFAGILSQIPGFSQLAGSINGLTGGVGGLSTGFGGLRTAMLAVPIIALIAAVTSLVGWFTKTERGGDLLTKAMNMASAAMNVLRDRAFKLVDALIAFVKGDWSEAADRFREATSGVVAEIVKETKEAGKLADALDALEEQEGKLILVRARSKEQISELLLLARDETKSLEDRASAIKSAITINEQLRQQELAAARGRIMQALQITDLTDARLSELLAKGEELVTVDTLGFSEATQEDVNKALQAIAAFREINTSFNDEQRNMRKQLTSIVKKEDKEETANLAAEANARANIRALENEKYLNSIGDQMQREIEQININTQDKIAALQGTEAQIAEQKRLLEEIQLQQVQAIRDKYAAEAATKDKTAKDEQAARDKAANDKKVADAAETAAKLREIEDAKLMVASTAIGATISLLSEDEKARKKNAALIKTFSISQIIVDLQREIAGYMAHPGSIASLGVAGTLKAVAATIRAGLAISRVANQKFDTGGYTGPGGKYQPAGIVHAGEVVWSQEDVARFGGVAAVEAIRPTAIKGYSTGGPVNPYETRQNSQAPIISNSLSAIDRLEAKFSLYAERVERWATSLKVHNNLQDTEHGLAVMNKIRNEADV